MAEIGEKRHPIKVYCRTCAAVIDLGASCPNCPRPSLLAAWASFLSPAREIIRRLGACGIVMTMLAACLYVVQNRTRHFSLGVVLGSLGAQLVAAFMLVPIGFSVMFGTKALFRFLFAVTVALLATATALLILDEALVRLTG